MNLSRVIFWDTDYDTIHWDDKARYVIARVVQFGSLKDWYEIKSYYGSERIKHEMLQERDLDDRSLSFLSCIFDIPKEQFRCYTEKLLKPSHGIF